MVLSLTACAAFIAGCTPGAEHTFAGTPVVEGDTMLRFPSGAVHASGIRAALQYLGRLEDVAGGPFLLTTGIECQDCDAGRSVVLRSARDAADRSGVRGPGWYAYPGRITHFDDERPLFDSRLFWGWCLPGRALGVVQFATEFDSLGRRVRDVVFLSEVRAGQVVDDSITTAPPGLGALWPARQAGRCREVKAEPQSGGL